MQPCRTLAIAHPMYYVIDQNYFRAEELKDLVGQRPELNFVIPDIALLEMCKGDSWLETMRSSLTTLSACPERVFHSMAVGEALNFELEHLTSVGGRLLPDEFRDFIRSVLCDIRDGTEVAGIAVIAGQIKEAQQDIRDKELHHEQNALSLKTRKDIVEEALKGDALKALKNRKITAQERLDLIRRIAKEILSELLKRSGRNDAEISAFLKTEPLLLRFGYLSVRHALEWATKGGLDSFPAEKVTNDVLDQDYVAIASFFDGLLTKDTRVQEAYEDLCELLAQDPNHE